MTQAGRKQSHDRVSPDSEHRRGGGAKGLVKAIACILRFKFGATGPAIEADLAQVKDEETLVGLGVQAGTCTSLEAFENALRKELSREPPASTRRRRARKPE